MKVEKVSALRNKRGLRRVNGAEPQVVGLTPRTTNEWNANTMKTYILRQAKAVEPQKTTRTPLPKICLPGGEKDCLRCQLTKRINRGLATPQRMISHEILHLDHRIQLRNRTG